MTIPEALEAIRRAGSIRAENGKLLVRVPEAERARLGPALDCLRNDRAQALQLLAESDADRLAVLEPAGQIVEPVQPEQLNQLFAEQGTGVASRITAATVRDGLEKEANREPAKPLFGPPPVKVTRRTTGQTVTFTRRQLEMESAGPFEWLYAPLGIVAATIRQLEEEHAKGEWAIQVIQWPAGEVVFDQGKWKNGAPDA